MIVLINLKNNFLLRYSLHILMIIIFLISRIYLMMKFNLLNNYNYIINVINALFLKYIFSKKNIHLFYIYFKIFQIKNINITYLF